MGYPDRLLSDDETIVSEFRPHWSGLLREILFVLGAIAIGVILVMIDAPSWTYVALLVLLFLFVIGGVIKWFTTLHVITTERVIYRAGFIAKRGKEIPLEVVNDIAFNQTIFEKLFGTGDLLIESAGTHGQSRYRDIPTPEEVQSLLYQVREDRIRDMRADGVTESRASQLEKLSNLHDEGKLSDEEFEQEKNRLLRGD